MEYEVKNWEKMFNPAFNHKFYAITRVSGMDSDEEDSIKYLHQDGKWYHYAGEDAVFNSPAEIHSVIEQTTKSKELKSVFKVTVEEIFPEIEIGVMFQDTMEYMVNGVAFVKPKRKVYEIFSHEGEYLKSFPIFMIESTIAWMRNQHGIEASRVHREHLIPPGLTFAW